MRQVKRELLLADNLLDSTFLCWSSHRKKSRRRYGLVFEGISSVHIFFCLFFSSISSFTSLKMCTHLLLLLLSLPQPLLPLDCHMHATYVHFHQQSVRLCPLSSNRCRYALVLYLLVDLSSLQFSLRLPFRFSLWLCRRLVMPLDYSRYFSMGSLTSIDNQPCIIVQYYRASIDQPFLTAVAFVITIDIFEFWPSIVLAH